jgi:hypothetical protein
MPGVIGLYVLKRVEVRDKAALTSVGRCSEDNSVEYFLERAVDGVGERTRFDGGEIRRGLKSAIMERAKAMSWRGEWLAGHVHVLHNHPLRKTRAEVKMNILRWQYRTLNMASMLHLFDRQSPWMLHVWSPIKWGPTFKRPLAIKA